VVVASSGGGGTFVFSYLFQKCLSCAEEDARQRKKFSFSALRISLPCAVFDAQQRTIAVHVLKTHGKVPLPCKILSCALCRAFLALCRAPETHGKGRFPVVLVLSWSSFRVF
jgi:hypothetical protein